MVAPRFSAILLADFEPLYHSAPLFRFAEPPLRGPVEVWGTINGDVVAARLAIMSGGRVEGKIEADDLLVRGEHSGTAACSSVEIFEDAVVHSAIFAKTLACEAGATICGKLEVVGGTPLFGDAEPGHRSVPAEVA